MLNSKLHTTKLCVGGVLCRWQRLIKFVNLSQQEDDKVLKIRLIRNFKIARPFPYLSRLSFGHKSLCFHASRIKSEESGWKKKTFREKENSM